MKAHASTIWSDYHVLITSEKTAMAALQLKGRWPHSSLSAAAGPHSPIPIMSLLNNSSSLWAPVEKTAINSYRGDQHPED